MIKALYHSLTQFFYAIVKAPKVWQWRNNLDQGFIKLEAFLTEDEIAELRDFYQLGKGKAVTAPDNDSREIFDNCVPILNLLNRLPKHLKTRVDQFYPKQNCYFVMRNIIRYQTGAKGSGGNAHRDSFLPQLKIFIPLTKIGKSNGPLAYVPNSHGFGSKVACCLKGVRQIRLQNGSVTFLASMGDIAIADTSGSHQGIPLQEGNRDMITAYFFSSHLEKTRVIEQFLH